MIQMRSIALLCSFLCLFSSIVFASQKTSQISQNSDDGTETWEGWYSSGIDQNLNRLGHSMSTHYLIGLRFPVDLNPNQKIEYARLCIPAMGGSGQDVSLTIEGVLHENSTTFSQADKPSLKVPRTNKKALWNIVDTWKKGNEKVPLYYSSPNIAPIINEIVSLPEWGSIEKSIVLILSNNSIEGLDNYLLFEDYSLDVADKKSPAKLEIFETLYDTLLGKELLGRVTDHSITVALLPLLKIDAYIEYGTSPESYEYLTDLYLNNTPSEEIEILLDNLKPDTRYYYRLRYKKSRDVTYSKGIERTFHTGKPKGANVKFAIMADEHLQDIFKFPFKQEKLDLYQITLKNIESGCPDFFVSLGDFAHTEWVNGRHARTAEEALQRYLDQRELIDSIGHSIPFYLCIGNHDGEQGWLCNQINDKKQQNLSTLSLNARRKSIPNPYPDAFHSGNRDYWPDGFRENYFAWENGDALFIILDPYFTTKEKPSSAKDGWLWTIGKEQYDWLYSCLHRTDAKWKFIFIHHLTTTIVKNTGIAGTHYGRGGIEAVGRL